MPRLTILVLLAGCTEVSLSSLDNDPPVVSIFSHRNLDVVLEGYGVRFGGSVTDDMALEEIAARWYFDEVELCSGPLDADGNTFCDWTVPAGDAVRVRLEAEDRFKAKDSQLLDLVIRLTDPPTVSILTPVPGGRYYSNAAVALTGLATDAEDAEDELAISWTSDRDGSLPAAATSPDPTGSFASSELLSEGRHTLTVTVTDVSGKTATDDVTIDVGGPNSPPTCELVAPADGTELGQFAEVVFAGVVDDLDVAADQLTVEFESDQQGVFGTVVPTLNGDVQYPYAGLDLGTHEVTMSATDDGGATCTDRVTVTVVEPPTAPVVHVEPANPENGDDLVCVIDVASTDPQGDPLTYVFAWTKDKVAFPNPITTTLTGDTIDAGDTAPGQVWTCAAAATDGRTTGSPGTDSVTIATPVVAEIHAAEDHTCQLDTNDELECFGDPSLSRLDLSDGFYTSVGVGNAHTCGVDLYGGIQCAGYDAEGQATAPLGSSYVSLDAGDAHNCAITTGGSLTCWGSVIDGVSSTVGLTGTYVQVSSAFRHNCAVRDDDGMDCWGNSTFGRTTPTPGVSWSAVSAGKYHTCGLDVTGLAVCFGQNADGESSPPGGTFAQVSAGDGATCGVRGSGTLECWGRDTGPGEPLEPPPGSYVQVSVGEGHACAVDTTGVAVCWGDNAYGECTPPATWW